MLEIDDDKTTAPSVASTALVAVKQTAAAALEQIQKESVCTCEMCGVQSVKDEKASFAVTDIGTVVITDYYVTMLLCHYVIVATCTS